jgi:Fe-S-cluster-containing dehydrogenase component
MSDYGILIDYEWCTGCHTCETACQMEHDLPINQFGIKLFDVGPWKFGDDDWQLSYIPVPTKQCNYCVERLEKGKRAACEHHCQAQCLKVAPVEELAELAKFKKQQVLFHN